MAKAVKSKVRTSVSIVVHFRCTRSRSSVLARPKKMLRAEQEGNFRNDFTLQNNATIPSKTVATYLSLCRNFFTSQLTHNRGHAARAAYLGIAGRCGVSARRINSEFVITTCRSRSATVLGGDACPFLGSEIVRSCILNCSA